MANLSIPSIRERLFNTSKHETSTQRNSNSTNPFSASSFKGNVLTADVFESSNKNDSKINFTGKLKASALVGSISGIGEKINHGVESIVSFCGRMKDGVVGFWNKMNDIEISLDFANAGKSIKSRWDAMQDEHTVQKYLTMPVGKTEGKDSLESMLISELGLNIAV